MEIGKYLIHTSLSGGNSEREPPDPISNSEVKTLSADDSVGPPHVKVGHCQAIIFEPQPSLGWGFLLPNQRKTRLDVS